MRAGVAGLRASGLRCNLRSRAALPPCRPRSVGRGGSAPSAPRSTRDVGQRTPHAARAIVTALHAACAVVARRRRECSEERSLLAQLLPTRLTGADDESAE